MEKGNQLYEGKAKKVFETSDPEMLIQYFKDDATAFNTQKRGVLLVDFKLEFGIHKGQLLLGDEIAPDTCRLWDKKTLEKLDKDRFRQDLGRIEEAYQEVLRRVME